MDLNPQTPAPISPDQVNTIVEWAAAQLPVPNVELTGFVQGWGAKGVLVEFDTLTVDQAYQLLELRRKLDCHVGIGNQKNLDQVVFSRLYPNNQKLEY